MQHNDSRAFYLLRQNWVGKDILIIIINIIIIIVDITINIFIIIITLHNDPFIVRSQYFGCWRISSQYIGLKLNDMPASAPGGFTHLSETRWQEHYEWLL